MPSLLASLNRIGSTIFLAVGLGGCLLGPDYTRPDTSAQLPDSFKLPPGWKVARPADDAPKGDWWSAFGDARLEALMARVMAENLTLEAAFLRVEQARTLTRAGRSALFPNLTLDPSAERSRRSGTTSNNAPTVSGTTSSTFTLPISLTWEIDLWGRLRRLLEAAEAEVAASEADFQNVLLTLQAEFATTYFDLRVIDTEILILQRGLEFRQISLGLIERRFEAGDVDEVDLARARTEIAAIESELFGLQRTRAELENALAVLAGQPSSSFFIDQVPLQSEPPAVPARIPAELLERRPDIARAERLMAAENARIGAAQAAFFPSLVLNGDFGQESASLDRLFQTDSRIWGFGPAISLPLFDGGRNRANLQQSRLRYEETVALYRQTILNAVREVDDALAGSAILARQAEALDRTVAYARRTVELSQRRYDGGLVAYFDVADAQRTALEAEQSAARNLGLRYMTAIALVRALGGAW